eukprot:4016262-Prymnesium_polylepis.1
MLALTPPSRELKTPPLLLPSSSPPSRHVPSDTASKRASSARAGTASSMVSSPRRSARSSARRLRSSTEPVTPQRCSTPRSVSCERQRPAGRQAAGQSAESAKHEPQGNRNSNAGRGTAVVAAVEQQGLLFWREAAGG